MKSVVTVFASPLRHPHVRLLDRSAALRVDVRGRRRELCQLRPVVGEELPGRGLVVHDDAELGEVRVAFGDRPEAAFVARFDTRRRSRTEAVTAPLVTALSSPLVVSSSDVAASPLVVSSSDVAAQAVPRAVSARTRAKVRMCGL